MGGEGEGPGADLLIQVDDFDLRVVIVDSMDGELTIGSDDLGTFVFLLEDNPNTVALVITWATDELDSIALTFGQLTHLAAEEDRIDFATKELSDFKTVIGDTERQVHVVGQFPI